MSSIGQTFLPAKQLAAQVFDRHAAPNPCKPCCLNCLQGAKTLLVGDAFAFFTLFKVISEAGLRALHLDRDRQLQARGFPAAEVAAAMRAALGAADCILASYELIMTEGFCFEGVGQSQVTKLLIRMTPR